MRRSRSSFDLSDAIVKAEALSPQPPQVREVLPEIEAGPLVAFDRAGPPSTPPMTERAPISTRSLGAAPVLEASATASSKLSALVAWLEADPKVTHALVVDDSGLPMTKDTEIDEALFGAAGSLAQAVRRVALATPGASVGREFESHVGQSPVLSLLGVEARGRVFVVAMARSSQPSEAEVSDIRRAFGAVLEGAFRGGGSE